MARLKQVVSGGRLRGAYSDELVGVIASPTDGGGVKLRGVSEPGGLAPVPLTELGGTSQEELRLGPPRSGLGWVEGGQHRRGDSLRARSSGPVEPEANAEDRCAREGRLPRGLSERSVV